jgi:hypothetical protein
MKINDGISLDRPVDFIQDSHHALYGRNISIPNGHVNELYGNVHSLCEVLQLSFVGYESLPFEVELIFLHEIDDVVHTLLKEPR